MNKSYFDGGLLQFLGWYILGAAITIVTLGICLPWAYCMSIYPRRNTKPHFKTRY